MNTLLINTEALDGVFENTEAYGIFPTPTEIFNAVLNGNGSVNGEGIIKTVTELFFTMFKSGIKQGASLLALAVLLSLCENTRLLSGENGNAAALCGKIIFTVALSAVTVAFAKTVCGCISALEQFTEALLPLVFTALASTGGTGLFAGAALPAVLIRLSNKLLLPMYFACFIFKLLDNLLGSLRGVSDFFKSASVWLTGGAFTLFAGALAVCGFSSSVKESITLRSVKYAVSSFVPVIGSNVSESITSVISGALAVKGALGVTGIIGVVAVLIIPVLNSAGFALAFKLFASVSGTIGSELASKQLCAASEFITMQMILLLGIGIVWFVFMSFVVQSGSGMF